MKKKVLTMVGAIMALCCLISSAAAYAAVNGGTVSQYQNSYLLGEDGKELKLDAVTFNLESGVLAYQLEPAKVSTRADAVYDVYTESNQKFLTGARTIMQYGYPLNIPSGLDTNESAAKDKARYATAVALCAWSIHNGASAPAGWADFVASPARLSAASGNEAVLNFVKDLMSRAASGKEMEHSIKFDSDVLKLEKDASGVGYTVKVAVNVTNANVGYTLDVSSLPKTTKVSGYTGRSSEVLTFTIPESSEQEYELVFAALDTRINSNFEFYTCTNQEGASKLVAMTSATPKDATVAESKLILSKTRGAVSSGMVRTADNSGNTNQGNTNTNTTNTNNQAGSTGNENSGITDYTGKTMQGPADADGNGSYGAPYVAVDGCIVFYERHAPVLTPIKGINVSIKDGNGNNVMTADTDDKGCINISGLAAGKYTFAENSCPNGYELNSKGYKFAVMNGANNSKTYSGNTIVTNDLIRLFIDLKDTSGKAIQGATITLENKEKTDSKMTRVTNSNGAVEFQKMDPAKYTVKVTKLPSGMSTSKVEKKEVTVDAKWVNANNRVNLVYGGKSVTTTDKTDKVQTGPEEVYLACRLLFAASVLAIAGIKLKKLGREG